MARSLPLYIHDAHLVTHGRPSASETILTSDCLPAEATHHFPAFHTTRANVHKNVICGIHVSSYDRILSCLGGELHCYIIDLRSSSDTYLQWCGVLLGGHLSRSLLIPADCGLAYYTTKESGVAVTWGTSTGGIDSRVNPLDPVVNIAFPVPVGVTPTMDHADRAAPGIHPLGPAIDYMPERARVLIVGMSGQVGGALARMFEQHKDRYCIMGTYNTHPVAGSMPFDLEQAADDLEYCEFIMRCNRPHIVIMCAAFCWVDGCQNNPDKAHKLNTKSVENVAKIAASRDAQFVLYSTDYVFDGLQPREPTNPDTWVPESQEFNPLNVYGRCKAEAEKLATMVNPKTLVLRTTRIYGPERQGKNLVYQVVTRLSQGNKIPCLKDEVGCPTYNKDLAELTRLLLEKGCTGLYHCSGPEAFGKAEWGKIVARHFGLNPDLIHGVEHGDSTGAPRPTMVPLSQKKLKDELPDFKFHSLSEGLKSWEESGVGKSLPWPEK